MLTSPLAAGTQTPFGSVGSACPSTCVLMSSLCCWGDAWEQGGQDGITSSPACCIPALRVHWPLCSQRSLVGAGFLPWEHQEPLIWYPSDE